MELNRSRLQGTWNIIRFNWQFYVLAIGAVTLIFIAAFSLGKLWLYLLGAAILLPMIVSLLVSCYVYDLSDLYQLKWLNGESPDVLLNINAGFDETSDIIRSKFKNSTLHICDFYDPVRHTEVSIKRAREAYPPHPETIRVKTDALPFAEDSFSTACAIFAAHEIRNGAERVQFFRELRRVTRPEGKIFVTEHLRDRNNFLAYTIGFLHFYSRTSWHRIFRDAQLELQEEIKTTPFVTTFILTANGVTS